MQVNRQILLVACAASALAFGSVSAFADDASNGGYYVSADGGVSILPNLDLKTSAGTSHEHFDAGYAYGGAVGYETGDGMRLEIDTTHQMSNLTRVDGTSTGGNGHLQSTSLMVNGQVDLLHHASVTPYVGAGLGYQNIGANVAGLHDADWKPAYQAEAGLRTDISPKISVFGEYRFSQSEAADLSSGGVSAHQHFADHGLLAGLTYHLGE
jgi:opacity protein-like surface antigen